MNLESDRSVAGRPRNDTIRLEYRAQIVCGHFSDNGSQESNGLRHRGDRFEVSQTPVRVAIAKALVEGLICSAPFRTLRVCMDRRDTAAISKGVSRPRF